MEAKTKEQIAAEYAKSMHYPVKGVQYSWPEGERIRREYEFTQKVFIAGYDTADQQTQQLQQELTEVKKFNEAVAYTLSRNVADLLNKQAKLNSVEAECQRLRNALVELWPLATNGLGELTTEEIKQNAILSRLSDAIDKAKNALNKQ